MERFELEKGIQAMVNAKQSNLFLTTPMEVEREIGEAVAMRKRTPRGIRERHKRLGSAMDHMLADLNRIYNRIGRMLGVRKPHRLYPPKSGRGSRD